MSSVAGCSTSKSGLSVQNPRSFETRRPVRNRPVSGSVRPGPFVPAGGDGRQNSLRSRSDRRRHSTGPCGPSWPSFSARRAAARSPATTQAFEYRNAPKCWSRLPAELIRFRSSSSVKPGMAPRITAADLARLLDHRPNRADEVEVARAPVVPLEPPRDERRLVDRRRLPFGHAVDRVFLKPVQETEGASIEPCSATGRPRGRSRGAPGDRARPPPRSRLSASSMHSVRDRSPRQPPPSPSPRASPPPAPSAADELRMPAWEKASPESAR